MAVDLVHTKMSIFFCLHDMLPAVASVADVDHHRTEWKQPFQ